VEAIRLILFNYNKSYSYEVVVVLNVVFPNLHEIKAIVSQTVVLHRSYKSFELVNVEFVRTQTVVIQGVHDLFLNKIEKLVPIEVNILGPNELQHRNQLELPKMRHVLAVIFNPLWLLNVDLIVQVVKNRPDVHTRCCKEPDSPGVASIRVFEEKLLQTIVCCYLGREKV